MEEYGERLRAARQAAGLSLEDATYEVRTLIGRKITRKTLERVELAPRPEDRADERLVVGLCRLYRVDPDWVSPVIAQRARRLAVLLGGNTNPVPGEGAVTERYPCAA